MTYKASCSATIRQLVGMVSTFKLSNQIIRCYYEKSNQVSTTAILLVLLFRSPQVDILFNYIQVSFHDLDVDLQFSI